MQFPFVDGIPLIIFVLMMTALEVAPSVFGVSECLVWWLALAFDAPHIPRISISSHSPSLKQRELVRQQPRHIHGRKLPDAVTHVPDSESVKIFLDFFICFVAMP